MKATRENNYLYNAKLKDHARKLRRNGTKAEAYLWKFALKNKIMGYQFLRQRPILNFIADFMCFELMLIIEVDGVSHLLEERQEKDKVRQKMLEDVGFKVLRFEDEVILNNMSMVLTVLEQEIRALESG